ncbi:MAG TPA: hypothetical protein VFE78_01805 [Gemmataceae bacterium]|jgi:hypothetical protein|nr:hypothetical protein [Gemmataceae bacterium]
MLLAGRLILFALLAVDWAADQPVPGCVFSPALSSTEAYSASADHREGARKEIDSGAAGAALPALAGAPAPADFPLLAPAGAPIRRHADLLRLYMTLLC